MSAALAVVGGFGILGLKLLAFFIPGSVALLSDTLKSIVNIATSITMLVSVRISGIPADSSPQYGHHKCARTWTQALNHIILHLMPFIARDSWRRKKND